MTTPILAPPLSERLAPPHKKKRVLLVDTWATKRDLRAEVMRKLGMEVDCAADIVEARSWWRADLYSLVIIHAHDELRHWDKFCEEVRGATPPQQIAFLVGKPEYLANAPNAESAPPVHSNGNQSNWGDVRAALAANIPGSIPQRWGILEASRRISAVRSVSAARTRAMRERPAPPRDLETRYAKQDAWSQILPELKKEDMQ